MTVLHPHSDHEFHEVLSSAGNKLVVIDFFADWCGPCRFIAPEFEKLAQTYHENAVFVKVDVDRLQGAAQEFGVRAMPTFFVVRNGAQLGSVRGADPAGLKSLIQKHYQEPAPAKATADSSVHDLRAALSKAGIDMSECVERADLVALARKHGLLA